MLRSPADADADDVDVDCGGCWMGVLRRSDCFISIALSVEAFRPMSIIRTLLGPFASIADFV